MERDPLQAFARLADEKFEGLYVVSPHLNESLQVGRLLQNEQILVGMPDGVVMLDPDNVVLWGNPQFRTWCGNRDVVGLNFYNALGNPEILGPDFCPFHTALATGRASSSKLRVGDHQFFEVHAAPLQHVDQASLSLIVTIRDITEEKLQQQKLAAIHKAGVELANLTPEEVFQMGVGRPHRVAQVEHSALHPESAEFRCHRDPAAGPGNDRADPAAVGRHGHRRRQATVVSPGRATTA